MYDTPCFSRFQAGTLFMASAKGGSCEWSECFSAGQGMGRPHCVAAPGGAYVAAGLGLCHRGPVAALCPLVGRAVRGNHGRQGPPEEGRRQVQRREPPSYSRDLGMRTIRSP